MYSFLQKFCPLVVLSLNAQNCWLITCQMILILLVTLRLQDTPFVLTSSDIAHAVRITLGCTFSLPLTLPFLNGLRKREKFLETATNRLAPHLIALPGLQHVTSYNISMLYRLVIISLFRMVFGSYMLRQQFIVIGLNCQQICCCITVFQSYKL